MCYVGPGSVYTGNRHDLPLMSPSGLVTLNPCVVGGAGHLPWLPYVKYHIVLSAVPALLSLPWQSLGWLQLFTLLGSLKSLTPLLHTLYTLCAL